MSGISSADAHNAEVIALLKEIRDALKSAPRGAQQVAEALSGKGSVADDQDLDGAYGDPIIKYPLKAKYWPAGDDPYVGYHFSETSPEYLDATAKYLEACAYMAAKDTDEKKQKTAKYKEKDASRARGWARRLRNGWAPAGGGGMSLADASAAVAIDAGADASVFDEIPF